VPRTPRPKVHPPAPKDVLQLFRLANETDPDFATFLMLAAAIGAGRSELLALRQLDIDFESRHLTVARAVVLGISGLVEKSTKTHAARQVALDAKTMGAVTTHSARMAERAKACGTVLAPNHYISSHEPDCSAPWRPDSTTRAFRSLLTY
jgi:integrase